MSFSDAEMLLATQIAYMNIPENSTIREYIDYLMGRYGSYDEASRTYSAFDDAPDSIKRQFEALNTFQQIVDNNHLTGWEDWTVVAVSNQEHGSGMYGCLVDTGDGNAIIGFRGSESYDGEQGIKDWLVADVGLLNNTDTAQQKDATKFMEIIWKMYRCDYVSFYVTGHSLGGNLAEHAVITAPEGMQEKVANCISFDGPGFSTEYLEYHQDDYTKISQKLTHYGWSWVGELLIQVPGANNINIKAHYDEGYTGFDSFTHRHATYNVEFDENGNVQKVNAQPIEQTIGNIVKALDIATDKVIDMVISGLRNVPFLDDEIVDKIGFALRELSNPLYLINRGLEFKEYLDQIITDAVNKFKKGVENLTNALIDLAVDGEYQVNYNGLAGSAASLYSVEARLLEIAGEVAAINSTIPYASVSATYYKTKIGLTTWSISSVGNKLGKVAGAAESAIQIYQNADQAVAGLYA